MAIAQSFEVNVVSPFGPIAHAETDAVIAPGRLGEFEVLPGHVPFLTELHAGVLRLGEKGGDVFAVGAGVLEVEPSGRVQVLVERAVAAARVDSDAARAELAEVEPKLATWEGDLDADYKNLKAREEWARAQLAAVDAGAN